MAIITFMNGSIGPGGWLKILVPLAFAAVFTLSPRAHELDRLLKSLSGSRINPQGFAAILEYEPWRTDALERQAAALMADRQMDAALGLLLRADLNDRLSVEGYRLMAEIYQTNGQIGLALPARQKVLFREPEKRENYLEVYRLQMKLEMVDESLVTLGDLLKRFPDDAEGLFLSGLIGFAGNDEAWLQRAKKAAEVDERYQEPWEILRAAANQADQSNNEAHTLLMRGRGLGAVDAWQLAEMVFEESVRVDPLYAEGWAYLGEARQQTSSGDGWTELEKASSLDARSLTVKGLKALYLRRHRQFDQALDLISQAAKIEPDRASWQVEWAHILVESGDLREALVHYKKALAVEPANPENKYLLAAFCLNYQIELRETGLPAAREGAVQEPGNARWPDVLGRIFQTLGDYDLARRSYRQAIEMDPAFHPARLHLGQMYLERENTIEAYPLIKAAAEQRVDEGTREIAARLLMRYYNEQIQDEQ